MTRKHTGMPAHFGVVAAGVHVDPPGVGRKTFASTSPRGVEFAIKQTVDGDRVECAMKHFRIQAGFDDVGDEQRPDAPGSPSMIHSRFTGPEENDPNDYWASVRDGAGDKCRSMPGCGLTGWLLKMASIRVCAVWISLHRNPKLPCSWR